MFKRTKTIKFNMKLTKVINRLKHKKEKIKQKIKQKSKKNIIKRNLKIEFEEEFGDLESMSYEEVEHPIIPITNCIFSPMFEIGDFPDDDIELGLP